MSSILALIARLLMALIFVPSAVMKVLNFRETLEGMDHVPAAPAALALATILELLGIAMLLLGFWGRVGALLLVVFLVPVTFFMHQFWLFEGEQQMVEAGAFMRNLAILGGLLMFVAHGTGRFSLDRWLARRKRKAQG